MWRLSVVLVLLLAGCTGPMAVEQPPSPCDETTEFDFIGRASMSALGLSHPMDPDAERIGMAWVTRGPVRWGPPADLGPDMLRAVCVSWGDGSSMGQSIEDDWQPPNALFGGGGSADPVDAPSGGLLMILLAALLVGASAFAFRRDRHGGASPSSG